MRRTLSLTAAALSAAVLAGCAQLSDGERHPEDPFESVNRQVFDFNTTVDDVLLRPVAETYVEWTPGPVRTGVSNFYDNLFSPSHAVNHTLQGKVDDGIEAAFRFLVNTTFGVFGIFDVASKIGLERKPEDFGQTLGAWGVPSGPYLMLPVLGPSSARDVWRYAEEFGSSPLTYALHDESWYWATGIGALGAVDVRARLLKLDGMRENAVDEYAALRDAYLARRRLLVADGAVDEEAELEELTPLSFEEE